MVSLTLNDLTTTEVKSIMFILDALRSGKEVEVRVGNPHCEDGSCSVPHTSEPVAIDSPYAEQVDTVDAEYEINEKPKKKRARRAAKAPKSTHGSPALDADAAKLEALGADPGPTLDQIELPEVVASAPAPTPAPVVAVPAVTKVDVDAALGEVAKKGMTVARSLLTQFGVARSRDLPVEKYPAFIARAKEIAGT